MTQGPLLPPRRLRQEGLFSSPSLPGMAFVQEAYMGPLQSLCSLASQSQEPYNQWNDVIL